MSFRVSSDAVKDRKLQDKYGDRCSSEDIVNNIPQISFPFSWSGAPERTESFAAALCRASFF